MQVSAVDQFIRFAFALEDYVLKPLCTPLEKYVAVSFPQPYSWLQTFLDNTQSIHAKNFPLMNPFHVFALVLFYLLVVFGGKLVMTTIVREKLNVKSISNIHNAFLVWLSAYMCINILYQAFVVLGYSIFDNHKDETAKSFMVFITYHIIRLAKYVWLFYFSKIFEFVDTFIMVAKMSFRQISFLHVYHHASIFAIWWFTVHMAPTSEAYFSSTLNSFIHVVMYGYYLFTSLGVANGLMQSIKPFITIGQLTQFSLMMIQATYDIVSYTFLSTESEKAKKYPIGLMTLLWFYMWTMLGLFSNFYRQNYKKKASDLKKKVK